MAARKLSRFRRYLERDLKIYKMYRAGHYAEEIASVFDMSVENTRRIIREMKEWVKLYGNK